MRFQLLFLLILGGLLVGLWIILAQRDVDPASLRQRADQSLAREDVQEALRIANRLLSQNPNSDVGLLIKGLSHFQAYDCRRAEIALLKALEINAQLIEAHRALVKIYKSQGRFWELQPHALALLRVGDSGSEFLIPLAAPDELDLSEPEIRFAAACQQAVPEDSTSQLGIARMLLRSGRWKDSIDILEMISSDVPELVAAQCMLGSALFQIGDLQALETWYERVTPQAHNHPETWYLRGQQCLIHESFLPAIRCFAEALQRDANHRRSNFAMGNVLKKIGQHEAAGPFLHRFELLEEVSRLATRGDDQSGTSMSPQTLHRIASVMEELGRFHESAAWYRQSLNRGESSQTRESLNHVLEQLNDDTMLTSSNPVFDLNFKQYPLPSNNLFTSKQTASNSPSDCKIAFVDQAHRMGLDFQFQNGSDSGSNIARMYEFSGGGIASLDFDMDYWPDIYLTQGGEFPFEKNTASDQLYRNLSAQHFENVTVQSGLGDMRFSQGVTIGDYDNDGFADIYLGNIGENRLYHNHGDGTFSEVDHPMFKDRSWTAGCALIDVNNDTFLDIYCLNYLSGDDVLTRRCERGGLPVQCPLHFFPAAQDKLYLSTGDGDFVDTTEHAGIVLSEGKGLGIVASSFHENGPISLFVANDDTPNYFFVPGTNSNAVPSLTNRAIELGLAFGSQGTSQSCMGVAAGDFNQDGRLDLFVTNYAEEPANLFMQSEDGYFEDVAVRFGLHQPTINPMGWGTQFIDADLDGWLDLIAVNGHLDANTASPLSFKMVPQCFHNMSGTRFEEISSDKLGTYFEKLHAGRAVAKMDWNRDGANDVCVSHVDEPVALLLNTSSLNGNSISLHLRGVNTCRDAIGAMVRVTHGQEHKYGFLTAGDGFQASNEKKMILGLGTWDSVDEVMIYWPNGHHQALMSVPINGTMLIVEGQPPLPLEGPSVNNN